MTSIMTREQAQALREARDQETVHLNRKPKYELVAIYQSEGGFGGGTWSKQDLMGSILEKRYPVARQNEAIHVLGHEPGERWAACRFCQCQETWLADGAPMLPGTQVIEQCVLDPGHRGFCRDDQGRDRDGIGPEDCDICQTTNGCRCNAG